MVEIKEDYLKQLSDEELRELYKETKKEMEYQDSLSLAFKIFLNSYYGSNALSHNPFSNGKLTNASVTILGRMWIQLTGMVLSNKVRELLGEPHTCELTEIVQGDTDSVTGDSVIYINGKPVTIEEYFNRNVPKGVSDNKEIIKPKNNDVALSFNTDQKIQENKPVKYIMRHKTKKKMFRIKHKGKYIDVTEDHSVIVKRNGKYMDIKPQDIAKGDIITICKDYK